jgi:histidinol-phosphate aminotransferase
VKDLVGPEIAAISPYEPGKPLEELERELGARWPREGAIKLASNENALGPSPRAIEAAGRALTSAHLYPDGGAFRLRAAIAARHGVPASRVLPGAGSNELIDLLVHVFCGPGEDVVAPAYSFACYALSAAGHRRAFREAPLGARFAVDVGAILDTVGPRTKLVFLANPNNPTGAYVARGDFVELARRLPADVILTVDEAYFEYARAADYPDALAAAAGERERLVVLRTFSKIFGLAALRVGYAIAPPEMVTHLDRVRPVFNVSTPAQAAARAALEDTEHVERSRRANAAEIEPLAASLAALGLDVLPSQANFLLVGLGERDGRALFERLLERGVIVRPMNSYGLPKHVRITVGTHAENERLVRTLGEVL